MVNHTGRGIYQIILLAVLQCTDSSVSDVMGSTVHGTSPRTERLYVITWVSHKWGWGLIFITLKHKTKNKFCSLTLSWIYYIETPTNLFSKFQQIGIDFFESLLYVMQPPDKLLLYFALFFSIKIVKYTNLSHSKAFCWNTHLDLLSWEKYELLILFSRSDIETWSQQILFSSDMGLWLCCWKVID